MPTAAPRACAEPGCKALAHAGPRCSAHQRGAWFKVTPTKRITGRRLQAMRKKLFARKPLCELCLASGYTTLATQRDHRIPLAEGGADDETNEQALCEPCHEGKSLAEALRAKGRGGAKVQPAATGNRTRIAFVRGGKTTPLGVARGGQR